MSGDGEIVTEVVTDALVLPETALRYRGDQIYVETVEHTIEPKVASRDIEVGGREAVVSSVNTMISLILMTCSCLISTLSLSTLNSHLIPLCVASHIPLCQQ